MMNLLKYESLDKDFCADELVDLYLKDNSKYSNLFRIGYSIKCWELPNSPIIRNVGGLYDIKHTINHNNINLNFSKKYCHFGFIIIGIDYCNYWDLTTSIKLNNKIVESIKIEDLYSYEDINIDFEYENEECARIANSLMYYLVSPYRDDDYYLNIEMKRWSDARDV